MQRGRWGQNPRSNNIRDPRGCGMDIKKEGKNPVKQVLPLVSLNPRPSILRSTFLSSLLPSLSINRISNIADQVTMPCMLRPQVTHATHESPYRVLSVSLRVWIEHSVNSSGWQLGTVRKCTKCYQMRLQKLECC